MWYGRIRDINIWKEDSRANKQLTRAPRKEIQFKNETIVFYMGQQLLETDVSMLNLSVRSYNCLKKAGWNTIGNILENIETEQDLLRVRNLGKISADEIIGKLKEHQDSMIIKN